MGYLALTKNEFVQSGLRTSSTRWETGMGESHHDRGRS